ncbi:diguanylate cyclase response regulator [Methylophaga sp. 42_25_T18]|nr:diguanylate cyclase response regulator [Methylophaga sp. 42_25_T18]OUR89266.1 diguanylate cyclase response regulator [Methylophaga sp. 42_8_T64]
MSKLKALIIDDKEAFRDVARLMLESAGFSVEVVSKGNKGLEVAEQQRFHLVCCSNNLSDISASDFCGQLRAIKGYDFVSVLVLTDVDNSKTLKQALLAGATDTFSKSEFNELQTYVERFVQRETRQLPGRVLFVEDSRVLQTIILDLLTDMGLDVDAYTRAEDAWDAFRDGDYDLVLTDILLEGVMSGITLVRKIRRMQGEIGNVPIIAISGFGNKSRKIELFHLGVNDFISKPIVREELRQRVINHVTSYQGLRELRAQQKSLYSLSMLDELTQLFNRHALREFSAKYFSEAYRFKRPLSMAVLDIDHFKQINEKHGYERGDSVLTALGAWLKRFVRDVDLVARWSGEEFVFLLADCDQQQAKALMERLLSRLEQFTPTGLELTVSIGIATTNMGSEDKEHNLNSLFDLADSAMYQAKMAGRNCVELYSAAEPVEV